MTSNVIGMYFQQAQPVNTSHSVTDGPPESIHNEIETIDAVDTNISEVRVDLDCYMLDLGKLLSPSSHHCGLAHEQSDLCLLAPWSAAATTAATRSIVFVVNATQAGRIYMSGTCYGPTSRWAGEKMMDR